MDDTRPSYCPSLAESQKLNIEYDKVSIIMDYKDKEFYDFKLALNALVTFTPSHQFNEIIIIDDGTKVRDIKTHAAQFFKDPKFSNVKIFRSENSEGQSASRLKASKMAKGEYLVYVSSNVVVNQGWLYPLLRKIQEKPNIVAVPHHDNFLDGHRFYPLDNGLINLPTWSLATVHKETNLHESDFIDTPVMRGDIFAMKRTLLMKIGDFDEHIQTGHNIEFSFRTWMCGGRVQIVLCSRVAVLSALRPIEIHDKESIQYIAEMWMSNYKFITFRQNELPDLTPKAITTKVNERKSFLKNTLKKCQNFDWYLANIASDILVPSHGSIFFGKLKAATNLCLKIDSSTSKIIELELCRPHIYDTKFLFEMTVNGQIKIAGQCLAVNNVMHLVLDNCDLQKNSNDVRWTLTVDGKLENQSHKGKCVTQVAERDDSNALHHYAMLTKCDETSSRTQTFTVLSY
ncbi:hypothetical protein CAPTEDRAFT_184129 [Capitella teleta]|uniref:Polypeptide N-acetylgalactosaminyltransferase n=1 Tax=Capitella teleta TaxID=283909 RepID=R7UNY8_CAPTE|nr:hypothetical protein CAPTEDRAFT_184129 [Capitella teleta]|eukprot:ELU05642.1 hypothetical protein CAPTEDRAFT_184129 [Capitella teleta]